MTKDTIDCDEKLKPTFFYQYMECPFNIGYNIWAVLIIPDCIIVIEIVVMCYLLFKI